MQVYSSELNKHLLAMSSYHCFAFVYVHAHTLCSSPYEFQLVFIFSMFSVQLLFTLMLSRGLYFLETCPKCSVTWLSVVTGNFPALQESGRELEIWTSMCSCLDVWLLYFLGLGISWTRNLPPAWVPLILTIPREDVCSLVLSGF